VALLTIYSVTTVINIIETIHPMKISEAVTHYHVILRELPPVTESCAICQSVKDRVSTYSIGNHDRKCVIQALYILSNLKMQ